MVETFKLSCQTAAFQVHDFDGHVRQSVLFWIVQVPASALSVKEGVAHVHLTEEGVVDNTFFLGSFSRRFWTMRISGSIVKAGREPPTACGTPTSVCA